MKKILVIDDEKDICLLLERFLTKKGFDCTAVDDEVYGFNLIKKNQYDLVITDLRLPSITGIELMKKIKALSPRTKVIIITGYSDIQSAVEAMKFGACDYVAKPLYPDEILSTINSALESDSTSVQSIEAPEAKKATAPSNSNADRYTYVMGESQSAKKVIDNINLIAPTDMSVIISGETGTGKEFVAREIHKRSDRKDKPFYAIDCGAIPVDIAASEFFGHEKGAFTGAVGSKEGIFHHANGGTLFLDEIGNLSYDIQVKLLRVIQERKYKKVGGNKDFDVDVRILAATNENLQAAVDKGDFRQDLFFRLNEFKIHVAPLRNRKEDVKIFTNSFLALANKELKKQVQKVDDEVLRTFENYSWPGNLREMRNVVKRCVLMTTTNTISKACLPEEITYEYNAESNGNYPENELKAAAEKAEMETIMKVLSETGNNKTKAAQILNIDRKTLYNKLNAFKNAHHSN